jgi:hypothetical protein
MFSLLNTFLNWVCFAQKYCFDWPQSHRVHRAQKLARVIRGNRNTVNLPMIGTSHVVSYARKNWVRFWTIYFWITCVKWLIVYWLNAVKNWVRSGEKQLF